MFLSRDDINLEQDENIEKNEIKKQKKNKNKENEKRPSS